MHEDRTDFDFDQLSIARSLLCIFLGSSSCLLLQIFTLDERHAGSCDTQAWVDIPRSNSAFDLFSSSLGPTRAGCAALFSVCDLLSSARVLLLPACPRGWVHVFWNYQYRQRRTINHSSQERQNT